MTLAVAAQLLLNGIMLTAFYCLFAVGLTLVFGVMKIINFAHGELFMLGAFVAWLAVSAGSNLIPLPLLFFLGVAAAMVVVGLLGIAQERAIFRPLRTNPLGGFLAAFGLAYILQVSAGKIFGVHEKGMPDIFPGYLELAGGILTFQRLLVILMAVVLIVSLWCFLQRTRLGRGVRASSEDNEAAAVYGVDINRTSALVMFLGSALAATAGALMAPSLMVEPYMGAKIIWKAFIIIIVGGMGSIGGTIVASFIFGFVDSMIYIFGEPQLATMVDVLIMLLVLALKPEGVLGRGR